ncbi:hypothetical protein MTR67_012187 [Solanum verrucosum]|uniref:Uncharacterized protein n=1 Tax=Solanum verrucosum TaxID=315347 RepID=A0AAF0TFR4_SOLVR|nr:hypothetical protein MTR67_012187 [Solanum verrucosum]
MRPIRYRKAPPLLAFGWVQAGTLIDPPARIQVQLQGLVATVLMSLIEAIVDTIFWVFFLYRVPVTPPISGRDKLGIRAGCIPGGPQAVSSRATLTPDMVDREICMDLREGTSRSPPSQRDRFPSKAQGGSQYP